MELQRCRKNPWYFIHSWCFTVDESDEIDPVKLFPNKHHLHVIVWHWANYPVILVPKSRQMTVTWCICACYLWNAMFFPYRNIFFQSKKEDDANENCIRLIKLWERLPLWMREWNTVRGVYCKVGFKNKSRIFGIPSGADHARQYTASGYFSDEVVYQSETDKVMAALKPAIRNGGRYTGVSSAGPSYFGNMVLDKL